MECRAIIINTDRLQKFLFIGGFFERPVEMVSRTMYTNCINMHPARIVFKCFEASKGAFYRV